MTFPVKIACWLLASLLFGAWLFAPVYYPRCAACGKRKLRKHMRFHRARSLHLGLRGDESLCRHCCRTQEIHSLEEYHQRQEIQERLAYKVKWML